MAVRRVILVDGSRFMRELLRRMIEKSTDLKVVRELDDLQNLASTISETGAGWLFMTLAPGEDVSEELKGELFSMHPTLRIVGVWIDGSRIKMEWLGHQKNLVRPTLDELMFLFQQELTDRLDDYDQGEEQSPP